MKKYMAESQNIEFKSEWRDEYLKTLCAFVNTKGGELIIGNNDKGEAIGVKNAKKLLEDIPNKIKNKLGITPSVIQKKENGKDLIYIEVPAASVPVSCDGKYFLRAGSTTSELNGNELADFLLRKYGKTWDSLPTEASFNDIDIEAVDIFKKLAVQKIKSISGDDSVEKIFDNLKLLTDDKKITRAAILLFGKDPQRFYISATTRVGRFKGSNILDTVISEGNLFNQAEQAAEAIKKHLNVRFEIKELVRRDIWDYPFDAVREAVINAIIHKDYSSAAEIQIKIYDDRIWLWNPGSLPYQLGIEDLKKEHSSYPKNPLIAAAFYRAGLIEHWGSGTKRIVDLCKEQNLPEPEFKEEQGGISVWLYEDIYREENLRRMGLNERQIKAVLYVKENGRISNGEYMELTKVSRQTATRDLSELVKSKIFKKIGISGKGTKYSI
ncbi:MAG: helix-turn-helix domain-containing protein [Deltaproteobacteria bacterium]|nr:helix-turn-helix domain-containing protein [Deltaproteobacteria bacterium]MCL5892093.1 helix-turn-helix domain-containing protein [Deltaproteobacteria bacterium]